MNISGGALLAGLNDRQREAVTHSGAPLQILAGSGTGKTRVIVHRIGHLIDARSMSPDRILAVTFTNRAAGEMKERIAAMTDGRGAAVGIGTFHWLGQRILRRYGARMSFGSNFTLLTPRQSHAQLRHLLRTYPELTQVVGTAEMQDAVSALRNGASKGLRPGADISLVASEYVRLLRERNALDLDDLILEAVALLEADDDVRSRLQRHFGHILADEYQDTNPPQARLLRLLTRPEGNITVVGDDDQAIYGWRQADVRNMLEFAIHFPGTVTVRLEENYRSTQRILLPANHLLEHNRHRLGKTLFSRTTSGPKPIIFAAGDESEEVLFIRAKIEALLRAPLSPREIAVLYRLNAQSRVIEDGLVRAGIEYEIRAGSRFYERPEVARIVDILRVVSSPDDARVWAGLLNRLPGIGPKRSESIILAAGETGHPVVRALRIGGFKVSSAIGVGLTRLGEEVGKLDSETPVGTLVRDAAAIADVVFGDEACAASEREAALANVDEFISAASQFDADAGGGLAGFLDRLVLVEPGQEARGVQLMTMHAAKGLEFGAVFICGLEEGLLPHAGSLADPYKLEEERRLLYVGMTRAKRFLQLSYARSRLLAGIQSTSQPSRFLHEMPAHLFDVEHGIDAKPRHRLLKVTVGDRVRHLRWGAGTIAARSGEGWNEMIVIAFDDGTRQTVQRRHAPLERIS